MFGNRMHRVTTLVTLTIVAAGAAGIAAAPRAEEPEDPTEGLKLWDDPTFQKQFLGSYGFRSEIEPRVTQLEREQMEMILPLMSDEPEEAVGELEKIVEDDDANAIFHFTLGNLYFERGRFEEAAERYRAAVFQFPSFMRAHKNLGLIQARSGEVAEAIASLSRVIELGGGDALTYGFLGFAFSSTGQFVSAESSYRSALLLQPDELDWKLGLTQAVYKQRKYRETVSLCDELIRAEPDERKFWLLQANAYIGLEEPLKAAENYEILLRMGQATPQSLYTLGDIYVNESLWNLAVRAYGKAMKEAGREAAPAEALRRVEILARRGALSAARDLVSSVERTYGGRLEEADRKKLLKLEARMAVAEGMGGEAVETLEEIVALDPLDGDALMLLGRHYAGHGEPERAIFYYERAESLEDFEADAKVRLAQLLIGQARYGEAVPLLKRAQELEPRDDVARYLEQVERAARKSR